MTELRWRPDLMERVRNELDDVIGKERLVEEADLEKLENLQAVFEEKLQPHPVGAFWAFLTCRSWQQKWQDKISPP